MEFVQQGVLCKQSRMCWEIQSEVPDSPRHFPVSTVWKNYSVEPVMVRVLQHSQFSKAFDTHCLKWTLIFGRVCLMDARTRCADVL